jgi:ligand-binding sensor domain-containing protein
MRKRLRTIIFLLLAIEYGQAQPFYFRHYQVEQGLSNNTVFCTSQDQKGFSWLGTKDGLNRFDGYTFKIFRTEPGNPHSIGDNFIRSLLIDKADNLYAGTRIGLYSYDATREQFTLLYKSADEIRDIKKDSSGLLWFVAGQTLVSMNEKTKQVHVYNPDDYFSATSIAVDQSGNVWVATADGQLQLYIRKTNSFKSYNIFNSNQYTSRWIERIYAGTAPYIFAGTSNYGVKLFNSKDGSFKDILTYNADKTGIFARDFIQHADNEVWIATESGIFVYNMKTQSSVNLRKQYNNPYSISDNAVYSLCKDMEGGIWAGTYFGGVNYYSKEYASFQKYLPGNDSVALSGNAVREICEDKYGNLWIGTEDAGLNKLNPKTGLVSYYKPTGTREGISYPNIHGLLVNGDELWVGTFEHGLNVLDIRTGKVIRWYPGDKNSNLLRSNFIVTICQTRNGELFIGTRQGLYRFNRAENTFINVPGMAATSFIHTLLEDKDGILWIGTMGNGLFYYDIKKNKWRNFYFTPENKKGIGSNSITTLFEASDKTLWVGTEGGGLSKFLPADSAFIHYTSRDGFPSNTIFKFLEDNNKNLWITTSKGLVRFNPSSARVQVYTTANGLLSDQFNYNSGYKDANGVMYFGSVKGMISFKP